MEIVFLETISLGDDINLDRFDELGHVTKYRDTPVELVPERVKDADVVVINKIPMNEKTLAGASHLKLVAVTATESPRIYLLSEQPAEETDWDCFYPGSTPASACSFLRSHQPDCKQSGFPVP